MPKVRYFYCNTCERVYSETELMDLHPDICSNYEEVREEEYHIQSIADKETHK